MWVQAAAKLLEALNTNTGMTQTLVLPNRHPVTQPDLIGTEVRVDQHQNYSIKVSRGEATDTAHLVDKMMLLGWPGLYLVAANFLIRDGVIFTANVGDAQAIVVSRNCFKQLTVDHRPDNPLERQRIEEMGGDIQYPYVCRGS